MRSKSILLLTLALGCGLIASIGISQVMERRNAQAGPTAETVPIYVAMLDINNKDLLTPQNIKLEEWPKDKVPPGALTKLEEVDGKRCRRQIFAGEPILGAKLGEERGPSEGIPKGMRVVAVRVDAVSGGSSLIQPDARVDVLVYLSKNPGNGIADTGTKTILQNIKVYAVDAVYRGKQETGEQSVSAKTISLLVTPMQSSKVTLASELGSIRLALRSPDDDASSDTQGISVSQLFGGEAGTGVAEPAPKPVDPPGSLLGVINSQQPAVVPAQVPAVAPAPAMVTTSRSWKMVLMKGADLSEAEFAEGGLPTTTEKPHDANPLRGGVQENTQAPKDAAEAAATPADEEKKS